MKYYIIPELEQIRNLKFKLGLYYDVESLSSHVDSFFAPTKADVDVNIGDQHDRDDDDVEDEGNVWIERALQVVEHADRCHRLVLRSQDPRSNLDRQKYRSSDEHVDEHRYQHLATNT